MKQSNFLCCLLLGMILSTYDSRSKCTREDDWIKPSMSLSPPLCSSPLTAGLSALLAEGKDGSVESVTASTSFSPGCEES